MKASGKTRIEQSLSKLGVAFGWQGDDLYVFDTAGVTDGEDIPMRIVVRDSSLQISTPVYEDLSPEQISVIVWQEWKRRGEPTFLLLPEDEGHPLLLASRIPRLPEEEEKPRDLARILRAAIKAMARSRQRVADLLDDVLDYEKGLGEDAAA